MTDRAAELDRRLRSLVRWRWLTATAIVATLFFLAFVAFASFVPVKSSFAKAMVERSVVSPGKRGDRVTVVARLPDGSEITVSAGDAVQASELGLKVGATMCLRKNLTLAGFTTYQTTPAKFCEAP